MVRPAGNNQHSNPLAWPWPWPLYSLVNLEAISALHRLGAPVSRFTTLYSLSHSVQRPPCQKSSLSGVMLQKFETRYSQSSAFLTLPLHGGPWFCKTPPISLPSAMKENLGVTMWFCSSLQQVNQNMSNFVQISHRFGDGGFWKHVIGAVCETVFAGNQTQTGQAGSSSFVKLRDKGTRG
ncbi:hypothetical protein VFPPC_17403 [Pochonia chlamydosporia 170]|uniref:Uncharacterized protein n=1 Tax=Pochonia chlamydosporia 170 TaxID=1380566 RepID=A0A219ARQ4_METCM|nr:hypothetical protein VFPPC_17403 [Pochonia chlamydosporia 170]OWT43448.1 hypothetical protein VFPPC_17403 [Pochonia chlamydosporia 170]